MVCGFVPQGRPARRPRDQAGTRQRPCGAGSPGGVAGRPPGRRRHNAGEREGMDFSRSQPCDRHLLCFPRRSHLLGKPGENGTGSRQRAPGPGSQLPEKRECLLRGHRPLAEIYRCHYDTGYYERTGKLLR